MTASKRILWNQIKIGMAIAEVLGIVGEGNLYTVRPVFEFALPKAKKVMSFDSCGVPSGVLIGFDESDIVMAITLLSMN